MTLQIGVTERGDAALDQTWGAWVQDMHRPAILITKDPDSLRSYLSGTENVIVHCTITGYGGTKIEPGVVPASLAITGLESCACLLGTDRIVLRIDPIIPTERGVAKALAVLSTAQKVLGNKKFRVRVSFLDNYKHVQDRFKTVIGKKLPWSPLFHAPLEDRKAALNVLQEAHDEFIEVCAEPGIECTGCVGYKDCGILKVEPLRSYSRQRPLCNCLANKTELLSGRKRCKHGCIYCYWR